MKRLLVFVSLFATDAQADDGQSWCPSETETYYMFADALLIKRMNARAECAKTTMNIYTCSMDWMDGNPPEKFTLVAIPRADGKLIVSIDGAEAFVVSQCE